MTSVYLVRIDACGSVGLYQTDSPDLFDRGARVVCDTQWGTEVGQVLASVGPAANAPSPIKGALLRHLNQSDQNRLRQLSRLRTEAIDVCQQLLEASGTAAVVVDAVFPLDAQWIGFYVLGAAAPGMREVARELSDRFHVNVQFLPVSEQSSCGSGGCGSGSGGCSSGGCATCPAIDVCRKRTT